MQRCPAGFLQLFVRKSGCNDAELWLNRRRIFSQKEDDYGTTVCTPAEHRLSYFFFSGICAISAGVVVSLLQERYGFAYGMTGTLLSLMSVGNLLAGLLIGMLPSVLGMKPSVLLLTIGYAVGYGIMGLTGVEILLAVAFFVVGIARAVLSTPAPFWSAITLPTAPAA